MIYSYYFFICFIAKSLSLYFIGQIDVIFEDAVVMSRVLLSRRFIRTHVISNLASNLLTCQRWRFKDNSHKALYFGKLDLVFNLQRVVINVLGKNRGEVGPSNM